MIRIGKINFLKRCLAPVARRSVARVLLTSACLVLPVLLRRASELLPGPVPATVLHAGATPS